MALYASVGFEHKNSDEVDVEKMQQLVTKSLEVIEAFENENEQLRNETIATKHLYNHRQFDSIKT